MENIGAGIAPIGEQPIFEPIHETLLSIFEKTKKPREKRETQSATPLQTVKKEKDLQRRCETM